MLDASLIWLSRKIASQREFYSFALIGALAFIIDACILSFALMIDPDAFFLGRFFSFLACVTFTFYFNRQITFTGVANRPVVDQFVKYVGSNIIGATINLTVYGLLVFYYQTARDWPVFAAAAGSVTGLIANFALSKFFVFKVSN